MKTTYVGVILPETGKKEIVYAGQSIKELQTAIITAFHNSDDDCKAEIVTFDKLNGRVTYFVEIIYANGENIILNNDVMFMFPAFVDETVK